MGAPVCNLQYVSKNKESTFTQSGLLVAQLDKLSFFEANQNSDPATGISLSVILCFTHPCKIQQLTI